jgi:hypothetical protein
MHLLQPQYTANLILFTLRRPDKRLKDLTFVVAELSLAGESGTRERIKQITAELWRRDCSTATVSRDQTAGILELCAANTTHTKDQ